MQIAWGLLCVLITYVNSPVNWLVSEGVVEASYEPKLCVMPITMKTSYQKWLPVCAVTFMLWIAPSEKCQADVNHVLKMVIHGQLVDHWSFSLSVYMLLCTEILYCGNNAGSGILWYFVQHQHVKRMSVTWVFSSKQYKTKETAHWLHCCRRFTPANN